MSFKGAFTRRGMLKLSGGLGLGVAADAAKPAFSSAGVVSPLDGPTDVAVDAVAAHNHKAFNAADALLDIRRDAAGANHYTRIDYDIMAMKSWAPWARGLKQRQREYQRMRVMDKLKKRYGITW